MTMAKIWSRFAFNVQNVRVAIWRGDSQENYLNNVATRCQDFKAKMHQIRFRLGLRLRPSWEAYSACLNPLVGFKDTYF